MKRPSCASSGDSQQSGGAGGDADAGGLPLEGESAARALGRWGGVCRGGGGAGGRAAARAPLGPASAAAPRAPRGPNPTSLRSSACLLPGPCSQWALMAGRASAGRPACTPSSKTPSSSWAASVRGGLGRPNGDRASAACALGARIGTALGPRASGVGQAGRVVWGSRQPPPQAVCPALTPPPCGAQRRRRHSACCASCGRPGWSLTT
jgi:hypothetical protein